MLLYLIFTESVYLQSGINVNWRVAYIPTVQVCDAPLDPIPLQSHLHSLWWNSAVNVIGGGVGVFTTAE